MTHLETIRRGIAFQLWHRGHPTPWRSVRVRAVPEPGRPGWWMLSVDVPGAQAAVERRGFLGARRRSRRRLLRDVAWATGRRAWQA